MSRSMAVRRALPFGLLALSCGACSLFVGLDGFSGGADPLDSGSPDVATDGGGRTDGPASEGGGPDATGDAGADAVAASGFCAARKSARFCEDFDQGVSASVWQRKVTGAHVVADVPNGDVGRAPRALAAEVNAAAKGDEAELQHEIEGGKLARFRLSYDIKIERRPTSGYTEVNELRFAVPGGTAYLFLNIDAAKVGLREEATINGTFEGRQRFSDLQIADGAWHRLSYDVDIGVGAKGIALWVDGQRIGDAPLDLVGQSEALLSVGVTWADNGPSARYLVDNVLVEDR